MNTGKSSWRQEVPDFLQYLEESLGCRLRLHEEILGFNLYFVDLSSWKLRFSDRTPVIWVPAEDLSEFSSRDLAQSLTDVVRSRSLAERTPIILVQGSGQ